MRDAKLDKPDLPVWILTCDNATYRVRLVGDMTDRVEKLADGKSDHVAPATSRCARDAPADR